MDELPAFFSHSLDLMRDQIRSFALGKFSTQPAVLMCVLQGHLDILMRCRERASAFGHVAHPYDEIHHCYILVADKMLALLPMALPVATETSFAPSVALATSSVA